MADTEVGGLVVQIKAKADNLVNGLKQANTSITGFQSNFIKSFGAIAAIGAASFAAVGFAIKQTVDAAAEAEAAQNDLAIALRNAGDGSQAALQSSLDYSAALQRQTGISDELITATQTELVQYGLTGEALKIATQATLDLSTAMGSHDADRHRRIICRHGRAFDSRRLHTHEPARRIYFTGAAHRA